MKPFATFFADLMPLVPSCPEPVAELALRRAAQRFCDLSRAWRVVLDPITLAEGIDAYDVELPQRTELVRIEAAKLNGHDVHVATRDEETQRGRDYVFCPDGKEVYVNPVPGGPGALALTACLKPSNAAAGVEDFIADGHLELIARGAAGRLMQQRGKAYSDPSGGLLMWGEFEGECLRIRERARRGFGRAPARVVPHHF